MKTRLAMLKEENKYEIETLDQEYKQKLLSDEDYQDKKTDLIWKGYDIYIKESKLELQELSDKYDEARKAIIKTGKLEGLSNLTEKYKLDVEKVLLDRKRAFDKASIDEEKLTTDTETRKAKIELELAESTRKTKDVIVRAGLKAKLDVLDLLYFSFGHETVASVTALRA